jgi:hypothetical protein
VPHDGVPEGLASFCGVPGIAARKLGTNRIHCRSMDVLWIYFAPVGQQRAAGDAGARAATSRAGADFGDGTKDSHCFSFVPCRTRPTMAS